MTMKKSLEEHFDQPITDSDAEPIDRLFEKSAGVDTAAMRDLHDEIVGDLDEREFGIGWCEGSPRETPTGFLSTTAASA
jgi:hypothetical protein